MSTSILSQSLEALLQIENDNGLIEFTCPTTGLPIWPLIRVPVLRTIMSDWLYKSTPLSSPGQNIPFKRLVRDVALSTIHNMSHKKNFQGKVLIQSTGLGNFMRDESVYDRLVGNFSEALPEQTLVYQDRPKEYFRQKYSFGPVLYKTPQNIIHKIYSRLAIKNNHRTLAHHVINRVTKNSSAKLGYKFDGDQIKSLSTLLARHLTLLPYASEVYANWFSKQGFRLLLQEDSCYGGAGISFMHGARLNGIIVAEYQHGAISKGHDAYNVAKALVDSDLFKTVLPDYLLTYGNWWSNQANIPVKKIAIGNPHLTEAISYTDSCKSKKNQVLILGDGIETEKYINLASAIYNIVKDRGMIVVFRPHPFEREKMKSVIFPNGVQLDSHSDIYASLGESRIVISEMSTGLFEAVGLVDKVLLWETDKSRFAFPDIPFASFKTLDELKSILNNTSSVKSNGNRIPVNELWKPNWKQNYLTFVEGIIA